jgi:hypothetical protein
MNAHNYALMVLATHVMKPSIRNKNGDVSSFDNYRCITLSPPVTKFFEKVITCNCAALTTSETQKGVVCSTTFSMRNVSDY